MLHYDPDTGIFTWLIAPCHSVKASDIAGSLSNAGYIVICVNRRTFPAHRLAFLYMTGEMPAKDTDHVNGVRSDNRWCNIRAVSRLENARNQKKYNTNTSGVVGVSWHKATQKWTAWINNNNKKQYSIGYFADWFDAVAARKSAEARLGYHSNHGRVV